MLTVCAIVAAVCSFVLLRGQSHHDYADTRRLILAGALLAFAVVAHVLDRLLPDGDDQEDDDQ